MQTKRGLILGGTTEARQLAELLADDPCFELMTSLAGVTSAPHIPTGEIRKGGFGGWDGLAQYLEDEKIDFLVDATHPFAVKISRHAIAASEKAGVAHFSLARPPWTEQPDDNWILVPDMATAAKTVPSKSRAFLTIGRKDIPAFVGRTDVTWFSRSIESPGLELPKNWSHFQARPPFTFENELAFFKRENIDILVTKNSGSTATVAKLDAARRLSLPVVMVARPASSHAPSAETAEGMVEILRALVSTS